MRNRLLAKSYSLYLPMALLLAFAACGSLLKEAERLRQKYEELNGGNPPAPIPCSPPTLGSVTPVYAAASNWLRYVRNDGSSMFTGSGTACTGTEGGHYNSCVHGGELRRVPVTNRSSCSGLTATDALSAFKWTCFMVGGVPNMMSGGLADEKFLSDLIDFSGAGSWRPNAVTVSDSCGSATTTSAAWHTNTLINNFAAVTASLSLAAANAVYVFTTDPGKPLTIAANNVALVSQPGLVLSATANAHHVDAQNSNFAWLELTINSGNMTTSAVQLAGAKFCTLRGANIRGQILSLNNTYSCRIGFSRFFDANIHFDGGTENLGNFFHDFIITNGYVDHQFVSSSNDIFLNHTNVSGGYGLSCGNGPSMDFNILINYTGANFNTDAIRGNTLDDSVFMNIVVANTQGTGYTPAGSRNTIINMAIGNSDAGITSNGDREYFSGLMKISVTGTACSVGAALLGITPACGTAGASDFTFSNTLNLSTALVGKVVGGDVVNTQDASGAAAYAGLTDFFNFQSRFRGWGRDNAAAQFNTAHRGYCNSGNCRIWDMRPLLSDTQIRGVLAAPDGNNFYVHRWEAASSVACGAIKGATWQDTVCSHPGYLSSAACTTSGGTWQTGICSTRGLRNAYEILNDGVGNDNGICESNEACIHTPNIGAYQGHGPLNRLGRIADGVIVGVELWRYQSNGM